MTRTLATVLGGLLALVVLALGGAAVVLGEADDSPGLQLLGVLLVVGVVATLVRRRRRRGAVPAR